MASAVFILNGLKEKRGGEAKCSSQVLMCVRDNVINFRIFASVD